VRLDALGLLFSGLAGQLDKQLSEAIVSSKYFIILVEYFDKPVCMLAHRVTVTVTTLA
jgi:hypothetical protein